MQAGGFGLQLDLFVMHKAAVGFWRHKLALKLFDRGIVRPGQGHVPDKTA